MVLVGLHWSLMSSLNQKGPQWGPGVARERYANAVAMVGMSTFGAQTNSHNIIMSQLYRCVKLFYVSIGLKNSIYLYNIFSRSYVILPLRLANRKERFCPRCAPDQKNQGPRL